MTCGASNDVVRHARPARARRGLPADGDDRRADQRDHGHPHPADRRGGQGRRRVARPRRVGHGLDRRPPRAAGRDGSRTSRDDRTSADRRSGLLPRRRPRAKGCSAVPAPTGHARRHRPGRAVVHRRGRGPARADPARGAGASRASPSSTPRRGTASRSTPPAAATAPATSARCGSTGRRRRSPGTTSRRSAASSSTRAGGWPAWSRRPATSTVDVPPLTTRPKAATVGVGRQVILRPAIQKRYVELDEPTLADQRTDLARLLEAIDDLEPVADLYVLRRLPTVLRAADFKVTAVVVDEALIDVEPGDTTGCGTPSPSTSAPPPWSPPCSTSPPARRSRWPRCSTSSSRSAAT